jgi:hypothetical protein
MRVTASSRRRSVAFGLLAALLLVGFAVPTATLAAAAPAAHAGGGEASLVGIGGSYAVAWFGMRINTVGLEQVGRGA